MFQIGAVMGLPSHTGREGINRALGKLHEKHPIGEGLKAPNQGPAGLYKKSHGVEQGQLLMEAQGIRTASLEG